MNELKRNILTPPSKSWGANFRLRVLAAVFALALCCLAIVPLSALAVDDSSESAAAEEAPAAEQTDDADSEASPEAEPKPSSDQGDDNDAQNDSDDGFNTIDNPDDDAQAGEDPSDEPFEPEKPFDKDDSSNDAEDEDDPSETDWEDLSSSSAKKSDKDEESRDGEVKRKKKSPEEEAADKLEQAEAIYAHMDRLLEEVEALQDEYDKAQKASDDAKTKSKKKEDELKQAKADLEKLKEKLSEFVVKMYKQGGVAPYLDALCRSTSYEEFLSAWYMLDQVSMFGKDEISQQVEEIEKIAAEADEADGKIEAAKEKAKKAKTKLNRAKVTYLSLAPHAASLKMEAAELVDDGAASADAQAEYDAAQAKLDAAIEEYTADGGRLEDEGFFAHPCPDASYSSGFGYRTFDHSYHMGLDMAISEGTPYYAADDGVVLEATNGGGYNGGAGNWIVIDHGNGVVTKYMHSLTTFVQPGEKVVRGQNIGLVGNTGNSFGAHLHFQVEIDGTAVDPEIYL